MRYKKSLFTIIQKQQNAIKISLPFRKFTNSQINKSRILRIENAKFLSGYCFYTSANIWRFSNLH